MLAVLRAAAFLVLFIMVQLVAGGLLAVADISPSLSGGVSAADTYALCALELAVLLGALGLLFARSDRSLGLRWRGAGGWAGMFASSFVPLVVVVPGLALAATGSGSVFASELTAPIVLGFVTFAVLVGVAEELWFRGLIMDTLNPVEHPWRAILVSSVLFGLPHVLASADGITTATALNAAAVTLAVAVPFACVRIVHRSIMPLILWHAVIDTWAFLHTAGVTAEGDPKTSEALAALLIPALLAIGYLLWTRSRINAVALNPRPRVD